MSSSSLTVLFGAVSLAVFAAGEACAQAERMALLTPDEAFRRALEADLNRPALDAALAAAAAGVEQASRRPNPTIDLLAENFAGGGAYRSFERTETTVQFSQKLELGGDREARVRLAETEAEALQSEYAIAVRDLRYEVRLAYLNAQRAAAELVTAEERLSLARQTLSAVERRVEAARDPVMAGDRSRASVIDAEIVLEKAKGADAAARATLSAYWSGDTDFAVDTDAFLSLTEQDRSPHATASPELLSVRVQQRRAEAMADLERARARPDPTFTAGVRPFQEFDEAALVLGVSIPLTIGDDNSAAVSRAMSESRRARLQAEALMRRLDRELAVASRQIDIARTEVESIDDRLLPAAEAAVASANDGFARGGFSYLDVLDAQRVLATARQRRIDALHTYHLSRLELDRLAGAPDEQMFLEFDQ